MTSLTRREFVRGTAAGFLLPTAAALAAACRGSNESSATQAAVPARGGTLRVGALPPTTAVDPVSMSDPGSIALVQQIADYLAVAGDQGEIRPQLAERWQSNDVGDSWTFSLRAGLSFSDGRALTAKDVVASFDRLLDVSWTSPALTVFRGILSKDGARELDERTVRFELDRPFVDFPALVSSANYNAVILPADYDGEFERSAVGSGPFVLRSFERGVGATLERNPRYWRSDLPILDTVEFKFAYPDAQALAMQADEVDVLATTPYVLTQALVDQPEVSILRSPSSAWIALHMRVDVEPWTDARVRQALALSLDRPGLLEALQGGYGSLGNDHVFPPSPTPAPSVPQRQRDVAAARRLLAQAGHERGIDVTLTTISEAAPPAYAALLQDSAAEARINITIDLLPFEVYFGSGDDQPWLNVPLGLATWAPRPTPSQIIQQTSVCGAAWNAAHWCNEEFDALARTFDATAEPGERRALATKLARIQHDDVPLIVAYWMDALRAVRSSVSGVRASGSGLLDLTRVSVSRQ